MNGRLRQLLRYVPANLVPAVASLALVVVYTRLLSPAAFGRFNLAFSAALIVQSVGFNALAFATSRFLPAAERDGTRADFLRTAYAGFALVALATCLPALALALLAPSRFPLALLLPLALLRSLVAQNQAVHRAAESAWRFNLIECAHALLGLAFGVALVAALGADARGPLAGMVLAAALCAAFDWRLMRQGFATGPRDATQGVTLRRFAAPLALSFAATCALQYGDRFLLDAFAGPQEVGPYAVAWSLVERPTTLLSVAVSLATFQGVVHTLEHRGTAAARIELGHNGIALLALLAPGCAGLALGAGPIAAVLVGAEFRAPVAALMPVLACTALLRCVSVHFLDHAFHLSRRSDLMLGIYAPVAAATLAADALLVPRYGAAGAAWGALGCQAAGIVLAVVLARRVFPITLPWPALARIAACTALMALALWLLHAPANAAGLAALLGTGCLVYGVGLFAVGLLTPSQFLAALGRGKQREVQAG